MISTHSYGRSFWVRASLLASLLTSISSNHLQYVAAEVSLDAKMQSGLQAQLPPLQQLDLSSIEVNAEGLVLGINGSPKLNTYRVSNPERIIVDLQTTKVNPRLHNVVVPVNRYGIRQVRVAQFQSSPAIARLVFDIDNAAPVSFNGSFDRVRGKYWLRPSGIGNATGLMVAQSSSNLPITAAPTNPISEPTTIDGLAFNGYGQLVIQASRAIAYRSGFDQLNNTYIFTIPAARISQRLRRPILGANSPIEQIRLNQVGDAVVVTVKPTMGWQIRETGRTNPTEVALQLNSLGTVSTIPVTGQLPRNTGLTGSDPATSLTRNNGQKLIVIDPGHGGPDVGATRNGIYEKDIVLAMSQQLGQMLQQMGYAVVYTRTSDIDLDLAPRVSIAENNRASIFVSLHVNSLDATASAVNGVETYHAPGASLGKELAGFVHGQIIASTGANDRGVRSARFHVITKTSMPAILVETGFITNPSEAAKLLNRGYQGQMTGAIARGIDQFFKSRFR